MDGIQLNTRLSDQEMAKLNMQVDSFNKSITIEGRKVQRDLGKDDFLKLLITQLSNQDPTSPMENTEFIAQMAQFSSLEQMTNMNQEFAKMNSMLVSSQAVGTIGKTVAERLGYEYFDKELIIQAARDANLDVEKIVKFDEKVPVMFGFTQSLFDLYNSPVEERFYEA